MAAYGASLEDSVASPRVCGAEVKGSDRTDHWNTLQDGIMYTLDMYIFFEKFDGYRSMTRMSSQA